jgi:thiol-disulfide isomerase/thioredoxin
MPTLILYTKPDCGLCDEAHDAIERVRTQLAFDLRVVDISVDPVLAARYGQRIPVVLVDGEEAFEFHVDERDLVARIESAAGAAG